MRYKVQKLYSCYSHKPLQWMDVAQKRIFMYKKCVFEFIHWYLCGGWSFLLTFWWRDFVPKKCMTNQLFAFVYISCVCDHTFGIGCALCVRWGSVAVICCGYDFWCIDRYTFASNHCQYICVRKIRGLDLYYHNGTGTDGTSSQYATRGWLEYQVIK